MDDQPDLRAGFDEYLQELKEKGWRMPPDLNWACIVWQEAMSYANRTQERSPRAEATATPG